MGTRRFTERYKWLNVFKARIDVVCPNCSEKAQLVQFEESPRGWIFDKYRYKCSKCYISLKEELLYNHLVKRNCPDCGNLIEFSKNVKGKKIDSIAVRCKQCNSNYEYLPRISSSRHFWHNGQPIYFEYWYQMVYKNHVLWALNLEHLKYLEEFIGADLRERSIQSFGMMLTDKLPKWMQKAKNRASLIKTLGKLKEK